MMGSPSDEPDRQSTETQHSVALAKGFYIGKYEVTQELYQAVMGSNTGYFTNNPASGEEQAKRPVEQVSWYDAIVFCNKLSLLEGLAPVYVMSGSADPADWGDAPTGSSEAWNAVSVNWNADGYRLPTEAEWEYACHAGTATADNTGAAISDGTGWYWGNSGEMTHEVGKKAANIWGLHDMHGNVWEWCWDWYGEYAAGSVSDPKAPAFRVARGGGWHAFAQNLHSADRGGHDPGGRSNFLGFRVARSAP
jgi:formylglycine-generating enzyme required for sulfatase activity